MKRTRDVLKRPDVLFPVFFVAHGAAQFLAWAEADAIRSTQTAHLLWQVLATPMIEVAGSAMAEYFWLVVSLNSLVWGNGADLVLWHYLRTNVDNGCLVESKPPTTGISDSNGPKGR
jgi:hypothetical protein